MSFSVAIPARDEGIILFGDSTDLTAYLAARRKVRVYIRVRSPRADRCDSRGKITSPQLLRDRGPCYDVGRRDRPRHGSVLRARRRQTRRIRICRRLAQKDNDAAVHA